MHAITSIWHRWKRKSGHLSRWLLPVAVWFLELLFHFWTGGTFSPAAILNLLGFSLVFGGILNLPAAFLPPKGSKWASALAILFCTTVVMVELLVEQPMVPLCGQPGSSPVPPVFSQTTRMWLWK